MWEIKISRRCLRDVKKAPRHIKETFHRIFLSKEFVSNPFDEREFGARLEKLSGTENDFNDFNGLDDNIRCQVLGIKC